MAINKAGAVGGSFEDFSLGKIGNAKKELTAGDYFVFSHSKGWDRLVTVIKLYAEGKGLLTEGKARDFLQKIDKEKLFKIAKILDEIKPETIALDDNSITFKVTRDIKTPDFIYRVFEQTVPGDSLLVSEVNEKKNYSEEVGKILDGNRPEVLNAIVGDKGMVHNLFTDFLKGLLMYEINDKNLTRKEIEILKTAKKNVELFPSDLNGNEIAKQLLGASKETKQVMIEAFAIDCKQILKALPNTEDSKEFMDNFRFLRK